MITSSLRLKMSGEFNTTVNYIQTLVYFKPYLTNNIPVI